MSKQNKAEFVKWMPYILEALRQHRGSATPQEIFNTIAAMADISEEERFARLESGSLKFPNQVAWARQYLLWDGLLTAPKRGLWMLTPLGKKTKLSDEESRHIFLKWVSIHTKRRKTKNAEQPESFESNEPPDFNGHQGQILQYLQTLEPREFERFCADLLRHIGMERVEARGGSGDKGIDGVGYLRISPFMTTRISFQCKRYAKGVSAKELRDFSGAINAIDSNTDRGVFFTTGYFTNPAREAAQSSRKPIELVDGERLIQLLEEYEFGLQPITTFELNEEFLSNYRKNS
jgi:restriction system protein